MLFIRMLLVVVVTFSLQACSEHQEEQTAPGNHKKEQASTKSESRPKIMESPQVEQLPFAGFKERWNAVTEEQMTNLYMGDLAEVDGEGGTSYRALLTEQMTLLVRVTDPYVHSLKLHVEGDSKEVTYAMLTAWNQMITILDPEVGDVDAIFNRIGVGPNGNLTSVTNTSFSESNLHYSVTRHEDDITLTISYLLEGEKE